MTHGLPYIGQYWDGRPGAPAWSAEFDRWAAEALATGDLDTLFAFREKAPGMPFAHPTVEHFAPLFVTLGASAKPDDAPEDGDRRLLPRPLEALDRGGLTDGAAAGCW